MNGDGMPYTPFDARVIADPHPTYRHLRDDDPVHEMAPSTWAITRFDDIWQCFSQPAVFSNSGGITGSQLLERRIGPFAALANLDATAHRVRRSAVKDHLTQAKAAELRAHCVKVCRAALEPLRDGQTIDATIDFGLQLSVAVVTELLGISADDRPTIGSWIRQIFYRRADEHGLSDRGVDAYAALSAYCVDLASQPVHRGRSGIVDAFVDLADESGEPLVAEDLGSHLREVLIGGAETNPKALGATLARLAQHPDQRAEVTGRPELAVPAFLEAVRIDTPGQFIGRTLASDVELHGVTLRTGDVALLVIASGNRDGREFIDPDVFDIHRVGRRSLGFGHGVHFCIGRHVAVLESEIAVQQLLAVAPEYILDLAGATRSNHEMVHGFTSLPLRAT
jgi:cytochrome P450